MFRVYRGYPTMDDGMLTLSHNDLCKPTLPSTVMGLCGRVHPEPNNETAACVTEHVVDLSFRPLLVLSGV